MSTAEIIRMIQDLPKAERHEILESLQQSEGNSAPVSLYATLDQVKKVSSRVFDVNKELFQKLAK